MKKQTNTSVTATFKNGEKKTFETIEEASEVIYAHPTFSEAILEACADCLGKCLHLPKRN